MFQSEELLFQRMETEREGEVDNRRQEQGGTAQQVDRGGRGKEKE